MTVFRTYSTPIVHSTLRLLVITHHLLALLIVPHDFLRALMAPKAIQLHFPPFTPPLLQSSQSH